MKKTGPKWKKELDEKLNVKVIEITYLFRANLAAMIGANLLINSKITWTSSTREDTLRNVTFRSETSWVLLPQSIRRRSKSKSITLKTADLSQGVVRVTFEVSLVRDLSETLRLMVKMAMAPNTIVKRRPRRKPGVRRLLACHRAHVKLAGTYLNYRPILLMAVRNK